MTRAIKEVSVKQLFGRYDYQLRLGEVGNADVPRLSLLYGDNGTGKTTILKLIFHILSSRLSQGHKSYVASVPFKKINIAFSDGTTICASRSDGDLSGDFSLELARTGMETESALFPWDAENEGVMRQSLSRRSLDLLEDISDMALDVFYLGDTRALESDSIPQRDFSWPDRRRMLAPLSHRATFEVEDIVEGDDIPGSNLVRAIYRAERWLDREAIGASTIGETDAQQIYAEILRTVATASTAVEGDTDSEVQRLKSQLKELEMTSRDFARFGLGTAIDSGALLDSLETANKSTLPFVVQAMGPILEGQRAKLDAVRALYEKLHSLVNIINSYLSDKAVNFDAGKGLIIQLPDETLHPDLLSSGEKHLLLLFLSVFMSSNRSPLFIIDEPELSLNVKWQRGLVDSLLALSENSRCQFLIATHSIELLTKHMNHVVELYPHE